MRQANEGALAIATEVDRICAKVRLEDVNQRFEVQGNHTHEYKEKMLLDKEKVPKTVLEMVEMKRKHPTRKLQHFYADRLAWCRHTT